MSLTKEDIFAFVSTLCLNFIYDYFSSAKVTSLTIFIVGNTDNGRNDVHGTRSSPFVFPSCSCSMKGRKESFLAAKAKYYFSY